ncbi:MAG: hypothetical protein KGI54_12300 [Pseudomonadota bacterium]|nr:hypothetical protein [Pseudomonadota bacterium]
MAGIDFFKWLDDANENEILDRRDAYLKILPKFVDKEVIAECRYCIKAMDRQLLVLAKVRNYSYRAK